MPEMKVALRAHVDRAFDFNGFNAVLARKARGLSWLQIDQRARIWSTRPIIEAMRNHRDLVALRSIGDLAMKLCEILPEGSYTINELELVGGKCIVVIPENTIRPDNFRALAQAENVVDVVRGLTVSAAPLFPKSAYEVSSCYPSRYFTDGNIVDTKKPSLDKLERKLVGKEMEKRFNSFLLPKK